MKFLSSDLWASLKKEAKNAKNKRVAVAYFTQDHLKLGSGDLLITNASKAAIASGQTSAHLLADLYKKGVEIYSCSALHAKVVVLDGSAFVSSANLSTASEDGLIEAGIVSDGEPIRRAALAFIDQLKTQPKSVRVDQRFISIIGKIVLQRIWKPGIWGANTGIKPLDETKRKYWILPTVPIDDPEESAETLIIAEGEKLAKLRLADQKNEPGWVKWPTSSRFAELADEHDVLIVISGQNNRTGHATVAHHARILNKEKSATGRWTYVFYEPSLNKRKKDLRWNEFRALCKKAGLEVFRRRKNLKVSQSEFLDKHWSSVRKKST